VTTLSENEERLVEALRALPPAADHVSDTWTQEAPADAQRASISNFDEREREEA
jgi:hypothetical protein